MAPPETVQTFPLLSMICVAAGIVVPLGELTNAAAMRTSREGDMASVLSPPQAASSKYETASTALKHKPTNFIDGPLWHRRPSEQSGARCLCTRHGPSSVGGSLSASLRGFSGTVGSWFAGE